LFIPHDKHTQRHILFYGRFECGNLFRVVKRADKEQLTFSGLTMTELERARRQQLDTEFFDHEYDLYLEYDTNSAEGLMHWFFFQVLTKGVDPGTKIKLNIRNLHRTKSLYE